MLAALVQIYSQSDKVWFYLLLYRKWFSKRGIVVLLLVVNEGQNSIYINFRCSFKSM